MAITFGVVGGNKGLFHSEKLGHITEFLYSVNMSIFDWLKNKSDFFSFCFPFLILGTKGNEKLPKQTSKELPISLDEIMEIDFITEKIQQTKKRKQKTIEKQRMLDATSNLIKINLILLKLSEHCRILLKHCNATTYSIVTCSCNLVYHK